MPEETFTCDVCSQEFDSRESLADHMVVNHSTKTIEVEEGEQK